MKQLRILILMLLIQNMAISQTEVVSYPFKVEIKGTGKPIILIPGLACSGEIWYQIVDSLKTDYQCHILTLAGFDKQSPIELNNGYVSVIEAEIVKYINNELHEKPILIGHSLGGFLTLSIASFHSNLFKQLIIIDAYPFLPSAYNPNVNEKNILAQAKQLKSTILETTDSLFAEQQKLKMYSMITDITKAKLAVKWAITSDKETIALVSYEIMTSDLRDAMKNISVPILVLGSWYGLKDYGITKEIVKIAFENQYSKTKDYNIKIAEKAKHFIMWDEPNWTLNEIELFLTAYE